MCSGEDTRINMIVDLIIQVESQMKILHKSDGNCIVFSDNFSFTLI